MSVVRNLAVCKRKLPRRIVGMEPRGLRLLSEYKLES
jgi:hypothetical protein